MRTPSDFSGISTRSTEIITNNRILSILFILWLTAFKHREAYNTYVVYMHEEISGLNVDAPVKYNGVKVGYVKSISLNPNDPQQVILKLGIREDIPITMSTIASLKSEGITGVDFIGLKALTPRAPPLEKKPGEEYPVIPSEASFLVKLGTALQQITKTIKDFGDNMNEVLSPPNRQAFHDILLSTDRLTRNGANISDMLSIQFFPQLQQIMTQLNTVTVNMEELSHEVKRNPSMLLRGRASPLLGPGEK